MQAESDTVGRDEIWTFGPASHQEETVPSVYSLSINHSQARQQRPAGMSGTGIACAGKKLIAGGSAHELSIGVSFSSNVASKELAASAICCEVILLLQIIYSFMNHSIGMYFSVGLGLVESRG